METKQITHVSSKVRRACPFCDESISDQGDDLEGFVREVNHLLDAHEFNLMHVGQETEWGSDGNSWESTVAILGSATEIALVEHDITAIVEAFGRSVKSQPASPEHD